MRDGIGLLGLALVLVPWAVAAQEPPSAELRYPKQRAQVLGVSMAYVEAGRGDPIVFLHGNPTSSYLWRNVIPHLEGHGRCIAPDLIGMGDSEKLEPAGEDGDDGRYRYVEHRKYLYALLESLGVERNVTLVIHDWGSALGFEWAMRHPERIRGIAYMEAIVRPPSFDQVAFVPGLMFRAMRSFLGEFLILRHNFFVERILPRAVLRELSEAEMAAYRAPYLEPGESRRPTLTWPREVPFDGEPADVYEIVSRYSAWLPTTEDVPKLLVNADPGAILVGEAREYARSFPNQSEVTVKGSHFVQEDSPDAIGQAIARWLEGLK